MVDNTNVSVVVIIVERAKILRPSRLSAANEVAEGAARAVSPPLPVHDAMTLPRMPAPPFMLPEVREQLRSRRRSAKK